MPSTGKKETENKKDVYKRQIQAGFSARGQPGGPPVSALDAAFHGQKSQPVFIRHLAVPFLVQLTGLIKMCIRDRYYAENRAYESR